MGLHYRGSASPGQSQDVFAHRANIPPESDRAKPKNQDVICAFCDKQGYSAQEYHSLERWRAKNSKPLGAKKPSSPSDGRPPPERRDQVAATAQADEWFSLSLTSSEIPTVAIGSHDYIFDIGANVSIVNSLDGLEDVRTIQPILVNGINGAVTATKCGTHQLFGECLNAPQCRFSLISHHKLAERYCIQFDSAVGNLFTLTPNDPESRLPRLTFVAGPD